MQSRFTPFSCIGTWFPFALVAACATFVSVGVAAAAEAQRPNVLFVMTDDQGYWDTGATGNPHIDTPHIDRLAKDGTQFTRYYAAPVCSPTRAGLMTGRYYLRTGLYNTRFGGDSLGKDEVTLAQLLQTAGYRTGLFGKWHLGKYPGYQPHQRGLEQFFGHYQGHIERYEFPDQLLHNGKQVEARGYVTDLFTDAALDFIESTTATGDAPFFCAVMYNAPHSPFLLDTSHADQPRGDRLIAKYLERGLPLREARIYGMIERVDDNIGRLMSKLDELGLAEQTLVVFTSDNGGVSKFWQGGMRGSKASVYEGGVRVPCFVRWPGVVPAGRAVNAQTSHVDWLPTLCELAGADLPTDRAIDGKSLMKLLRAGQGTVHHEFVYHTWDRYSPNPDRRWAICDGRWKLLGQFAPDAQPSPAAWNLYDLESDPGEQNDVRAKHPQIAQHLRAEFVRWFDDVTEGINYAPVRIPVGYPGERFVEIEPSWSTWHGTHLRYTFDGYNWDTLEGWKEPGERAVWKLEVLEPGRYAVTLNYGCRPLDAGGVLRLSLGGQSLHHAVQATATAEQFGRFKIGQVDLPAGETELTAEVASAPGHELMRLNKILLERRR